MLEQIRNKLIELAQLKTPWTYSQLNDQLQLGLNFANGYDRDLIGDWLGEISRHEFERGRPLLSSLIIHQAKDREQGNGFYKLCEELFNKPWEELKANKNFEIEKMKECYAFWKDNDNYRKFKNDFQTMLTPSLKNKVAALWDKFWSGGMKGGNRLYAGSFWHQSPARVRTLVR